MIRRVARPMLASFYVIDGVDYFVNPDAHVEYTDNVLKQTRALVPASLSKQIPDNAEVVSRVVGGTKIGAGSLLALGKAPRLSAGVLATLAVPTILGRYAFWNASDKEERSSKQTGFLTHVALLGGLGITSMDTEGKPGLGWRAKKAANDAGESIQQALPSKKETESTLDQAGNWLSEKASQATDAAKQAAEQVTEYVEDNKDDWAKQARKAANTAAQWWDDATDTVEETSRDVLDQLQADTKKARKRVVKNADKAQKKAEKAFDKASSKSGRRAKKAEKQANKLQKKAEKAVNKAAKKFS